MPFPVTVQVRMANKFKEVCSSEQGAPWRCLYRMPFSEGITITHTHTSEDHC